MKKKRSIICLLLLTVTLVFTSLPVNASVRPTLPLDITYGNTEADFNIDILKPFDVNEHQEYLDLFEQNNINPDTIIAIITENDILSKSALAEITPNSSTTSNTPGGVIVVSGSFTGFTWFRLVVTNLGILSVKQMEADVTLLAHGPYLPLLSSKRFLGGLGFFGSLTENYFTLASQPPIQTAVVIVTGTTSAGEWFTTGGIMHRQ